MMAHDVPKRLTDDQRKLVEDHLWFAYYMAKRHFARRWRADARHEAVLAMCRAAKTWVPARGAFTTYATWWIRAYFGRYRNRLYAVRRMDYSTAADPYPVVINLGGCGLDGKEYPSIAELIAARDNTVADANTAEGAAMVRAAMAICLRPRERTILERRARGEPLSTIAAGMGVSKERVRQMEEVALRRLREHLGIDPSTASIHNPFIGKRGPTGHWSARDRAILAGAE